MEIRQVAEHDRELWDAYVHNHPTASPYHLFAWREAVEEAYGHKGYYLLAVKEGSVCGVLPLIHMRLPFLRNQLVGLPYCDVGSPLAEDGAIEVALLAAADRLADDLGVYTLEVRARQAGNVESQLQGGIATGKVSMLFELPGSSEALWNGFKSKLRSQIRKAEKNGLTFRWGQSSDINLFYAVFSRNMHDLGSPAHSKQWIRSVLSHYGDKARMGLVLRGDTPVGCGIILMCGKTVAIPWASTLRAFNNLNPNMLLYWNFLQFSADMGFGVFDFGRSTPDEGTYKFKEQWGAQPIPLVWRHRGKMRSGDDTSKVAGSPYRALLAAGWRAMPFPVANYCGPLLRKYITL